MYVGDLYVRLGGVSYFSPTFPRGGLAATFAIEVFALNGTSPTLECIVEHKNADDTSFVTAATFSSMPAVDVFYAEATGLMEQVRLNITVGGGSNTNMVYANVLPPQWRPY